MSGKAWRDYMASTLWDFGYGFQFWSYVLVFSDDLLVVDHEPLVLMDYMALQYTHKSGSVKKPVM
jgi:hypothetical protein